MKPEAQRIAIAEACGWTYHEPTSETGDVELWWKSSTEVVWEASKLPDYLNDLNAMYEAEMSRNYDERGKIRWNLRLQFRQNYDPEYHHALCAAHYATAAQRAEAFLKTLNLWKS